MMTGLLIGTLLLAAPPLVDTPDRPIQTNPQIEQRLEAVRQAPNDPQARLELGMAYAENEEYELAMSELVEAIHLNPENKDNITARANFQLGLVLSMLERPALATKAYQEALRLGLKEGSVYTALGAALAAEGKYAEAITEYREAVALEPGSFGARTGLASALEASGYLNEASSHYEAALRLASPADDHAVKAIRQRLSALKDRRQL